MSVAVKIHKVTKSFGSTRALQDVSLEIQAGEFIGLLGPNGAGKTTLISALAGLVRADSGRLEIFGKDVQRDYRAARRLIGVVPQELVFDPFFSVRETLRIQSGYFGITDNSSWIDEILENLDLTGKANANMRTLSGGMKRRVLVAQALVHKPPVIVLDEPTAGVDVELRQTLWRFIQRLNTEGHTIVLTTHYLEEAESLCSRIAMLKAGQIVALDSTRNLLKQRSVRTLRTKIQHGQTLTVADAIDCGSGWWSFNFEQYHEVEEILRRCRESGAEVSDIEINKPDLEDVFVRVMNTNRSDQNGEAA